MEYRREIDGLRALAVAVVILFHADLELFSAGFLGVDIFFVISGFLITTIIRTEYKNGTFTIRNFYERRIRRIIPLLCCVIICVNFFYIFLSDTFNSGELKSTSLFSLSSLFFSSNILAWNSVGYFAASTELLPLIHTWSLSVEEQYYLVFPLIFLVSMKMGKNIFFVLVVTGFVVSLMLSFWAGKYYGPINFYSLPTRAFQLLFGAMLSFSCSRYSTVSSGSIGILGIAIILSSIFYFDKNSNLPGIQSLYLLVGVGLVVMFAKRENIAGQILGSRWMVGLGLISFSAYLWHQPVLVLFRLFSPHPYFGLNPFFAIVITLLMSILTWKFVEQPFRKRKIGTRWIVVLFSVATTSSFVSAGIFYVRDDSIGVETSYDLAKGFYECSIVSNGCTFGAQEENAETFLLVGDSHARMLIPNLSALLESIDVQGFHPRASWLSGFDDDLLVMRNYDPATTDRYWTKLCALAKDSIVTVVSYRYIRSIHSGHDNYFFDEQEIVYDHEKFARIQANIDRLSECATHLVVVGPVPEAPVYTPNIFRLKSMPLYSDKKIFDKFSETVIQWMEKIEGPNTSTLYPDNYLCDAARCYIGVNLSDEIHVYYYDDDHLSKLGSKQITNDIVKLIQK